MRIVPVPEEEVPRWRAVSSGRKSASGRYLLQWLMGNSLSVCSLSLSFFLSFFFFFSPFSKNVTRKQRKHTISSKLCRIMWTIKILMSYQKKEEESRCGVLCLSWLKKAAKTKTCIFIYSYQEKKKSSSYISTSSFFTSYFFFPNLFKESITKLINFLAELWSYNVNLRTIGIVSGL